MKALYLPFLLQGIFMMVDEVIHHKRGLGLWERLGHPLDSMTVFVPLSYLALNEYSPDRLNIFIILSVFSCIFITKDEFIHSKECSSLECWLHAILFILHPFIFLCAGFLWWMHPTDEFLILQPIIVGTFMSYQVVRWSIPWKQIVQ